MDNWYGPDLQVKTNLVHFKCESKLGGPRTTYDAYCSDNPIKVKKKKKKNEALLFIF